jgi:hypothetical protein
MPKADEVAHQFQKLVIAKILRFDSSLSETAFAT